MPISVVNTKDRKLILYIEGIIYRMPVKLSREYVEIILDGGSDRSCVMHELEILEYGCKQEDVFKYK